MDWVERTPHHQLCHQGITEEYTVLLYTIPIELPSIMGLEGIHSLEALCQWGGCLYCPWCAKEGQHEGMVVNYLCTVHYHLGLVCALCLPFVTTSADTTRKHMPQCKAMATGHLEEEEVTEDDNGDEDDEYLP